MGAARLLAARAIAHEQRNLMALIEVIEVHTITPTPVSGSTIESLSRAGLQSDIRAMEHA